MIVAAFYHFAPVAEPARLKAPLAKLGCGGAVKGTVLIAPEGVNGTVAGPAEAVHRFLAHIRTWPGFAGLRHKESQSAEPPFRRFKVRVKREIVTMGQPAVDPRAGVGTYVTPGDWNAVVTDPNTVVIDVRNDYEVAIGSFAGAIDPGTAAFGDFPTWWARNEDRFAGKRVAMFCTGGIRCEKSTNYLISQGANDVCHLEGGILAYLKDVPATQSLWRGSCFVFDDRVSLDHGLSEGPHILCHACRRPIHPDDRQRPEYEEGVQCHLCADDQTAERADRFRERQRQIALARARGSQHLA